VNALDYLLKPVDPPRLAAALAKVRPAPRLGRLERVFVRDGDRCWIVRLPDIFLLESEGNYTRVCFGSERPLVRRSLNALETDLDASVFFRASRRQIVNLKWIEKVDLDAGRQPRSDPARRPDHRDVAAPIRPAARAYEPVTASHAASRRRNQVWKLRTASRVPAS